MRRSRERVASVLVSGACLLSLGAVGDRLAAQQPPPPAQQPATVPQQDEHAHSPRESWQRVDDILKALGVQPGAVIADIGAGDGFFTERIAKAVGTSGPAIAVDVDANALRRLTDRVRSLGLRNVEIIQGQPDDPKLPKGELDGALIVNAYHEMIDYRAMLLAIRAALKPTGRLVIVEPISDGRRDATRQAQASHREIAPVFVLEDARKAGFRVIDFEDPFVQRPGHGFEYLLVLSPTPLQRTARQQ